MMAVLTKRMSISAMYSAHLKVLDCWLSFCLYTFRMFTLLQLQLFSANLMKFFQNVYGLTILEKFNIGSAQSCITWFRKMLYFVLIMQWWFHFLHQHYSYIKTMYVHAECIKIQFMEMSDQFDKFMVLELNRHGQFALFTLQRFHFLAKLIYIVNECVQRQNADRLGVRVWAPEFVNIWYFHLVYSTCVLEFAKFQVSDIGPCWSLVYIWLHPETVTQ